MFNKKIAKRIALSQREDSERQQFRELELEKIGVLPRRISSGYIGIHEPLNPAVTNQDSPTASRLAAGFKQFSNNESSSGSSSRPIPFSRDRQSRRNDDNDDDERDLVLPQSTDEIQEEFDTDTEEFQYPRQPYPTNEMLLEEYSEIMNESVDDVRESRSKERRSASRLDRQPSRLQGRVSDEAEDDKLARKSTRKSAEKLTRKTSSLVKRSNSKTSKEKSRPSSAGIRRQNYEIESPEGSSMTEMNASSYSRDRESSSRSSKDRESLSRSKDRESSSSKGSSKDRTRSSKERISKDRDSSKEEVVRRSSSRIKLGQAGSRVLESMSRIGSVASSLVNMGSYGASSNNHLSSTSSTLPAPGGGPSLIFRDVAPLPIEIPEHVTDEDAFRRYLSVRRRALPYLFDDSDEADTNDNERSTVQSLGRASQPGQFSRQPSKIDSRDMLASVMSFQGDTFNTSAPPPPPPPGFSSSYSPPPPAPVSQPSCVPCCPQQQLANQNYQRKSASLSHAIMTLALLSSSAAQLRFVVAYSHAHAYPTLNYFLICSCIIVEILVGIGFVVLARFEFSDVFQDKLHSYLIFGLFVVTVANVIVAAFALDDHICEVLVKKAMNNVAAVQAAPPLTDPQLPYDSQLPPNQYL